MTRRIVACFKVCQISAVILGLLVPDRSFGQELTIPQRVELVRPGPLLLLPRICECVDILLDDAVRKADLIVQGALTSPRAYLSDDARDLYTDYALVATRVIAARLSPTSAPTAPTPMVVRAWGGETTINGVLVKSIEDTDPVLMVDTPLLLFLKLSHTTGKYETLWNYAFEIQADQRLRPLASTAGSQLKGKHITQAILEIEELKVAGVAVERRMPSAPIDDPTDVLVHKSLPSAIKPHGQHKDASQ